MPDPAQAAGDAQGQVWRVDINLLLAVLKQVRKALVPPLGGDPQPWPMRLGLSDTRSRVGAWIRRGGNKVANQVLETQLGQLYQGDSLELLAATDDGTFDLVFADPPFNLGKDYGKTVSDSLRDEEYLAWCESWIKECVRTLKPGGAFYLFNLPRWNIELGHFLNRAGMTFRHWVAIDIKYSLPIPGRLYPSHYSLLYYTKGKPRAFTRPRVPIPVCRHCGGDIKDYGGHRNKLHPDGLNLTDVWNDIPPVRHQGTKRRSANELSIKLLRRVLEISTEPGDLVFDPFGGSGTTYAAAEEMGRRWIGCELGDTDPIVRRLQNKDAELAPKMKGDAGKGMTRLRRLGDTTETIF